MAVTASTGMRFFATGDQLVKKTFDELGNSGKKMWAGIASGKDKAALGMQALSNASNELQGGLSGLIGQAGPAGRILAGFGVYGVTAAAAIGGLTLAFHEAFKAMEDFSSIGEAAAKASVTTDALQEMRFVVEQTGGTIQDADQALKSFTDNFGLARAGSERQLKWFKMLGFSKEDLQQVQEASDLLPQVTKRIAELKSQSEQSAIAEKLGIGALIPAIRETNGSLDQLISKAREMGVVVDRDVIANAKDAEDKFRALSKVIDVNLKKSFVDLAPEIIKVMELLAAGLRGIAMFIDEGRSIGSKTTEGLQRRENELAGQRGQLVQKFGVKALTEPMDENSITTLLPGKNALVRAREQYRSILKEQQAVFAELDGRNLKGQANGSTSGTGKLGGNDAAAREASATKFDAAIRKARDEELAARAQAAATIDQRLAIELQRLDGEKQARAADLERQVKAKELDPAQAEQIALAEQATRDAQAAAVRNKAAKDHAEAADKALRERQKAEEKAVRDADDRERSAAEYDADMLSMATQMLRLRLDFVMTQKERLALQLSILEQERAEERVLLQQRLDKDKNLSDQQRRDALGVFDAQSSQMRGDVMVNSGADLKEFTRKATYDSLHDAVRAAFEDNENFLDSLFSGIAKRFASRLEDELTDSLFDMLDPLVSKAGNSLGGLAVQGGGSLISGIFSGFNTVGGSIGSMFGYASGSGAPGVQNGVAFNAAEHGTEMMLVGRSGRVFDTATTMQLLNDAASAKQGGGATVKQVLQFDLRGAVTTERLIKQFNRIASDAQTRAENNAIGAVRSNQSDWRSDDYYTRG